MLLNMQEESFCQDVLSNFEMFDQKAKFFCDLKYSQEEGRIGLKSQRLQKLNKKKARKILDLFITDIIDHRGAHLEKI